MSDNPFDITKFLQDAEKGEQKIPPEWQGILKYIQEQVEFSSERERESHKYQLAINEHNQKVARQFYWLRWGMSALVVVLPVIILGFLFWFICNGILEELHAVAQAFFISWSFLTFVALYGILLSAAFTLIRNKRWQNMNKNPEEDIPVPATNEGNK